MEPNTNLATMRIRKLIGPVDFEIGPVLKAYKEQFSIGFGRVPVITNQSDALEIIEERFNEFPEIKNQNAKFIEKMAHDSSLVLPAIIKPFDQFKESLTDSLMQVLSLRSFMVEPPQSEYLDRSTMVELMMDAETYGLQAGIQLQVEEIYRDMAVILIRTLGEQDWLQGLVAKRQGKFFLEDVSGRSYAVPESMVKKIEDHLHGMVKFVEESGTITDILV